jgi:ATP-dependent DNA helicase RecG
MDTDDSVRVLEGIGPKREAALADAGITTVGDLLKRFPRDYLDRSVRGSLGQPSADKVTVEAVVAKKGTVLRLRRNLSLFVLPIEEIDEDGHVCRGEAVWFNQPWLAEHYKIDTAYYFFGRVIHKNGHRQILTPQTAKTEAPGDFFQLTPVYPKIGGIPPASLKKYITAALKSGVSVEDPMPGDLRTRLALPAAAEVLRLIHSPVTPADVARGRQRIKFDEALTINMGILASRRHVQSSKIRVHNFSQLKRFEQNLPFALTAGQIQVLSDIVADLKSDRVMNRLVQGDVGSGKTIIAVACAYLLGLAGYQTAYMAPTEILAQQHSRTFEEFLAPYGISTVLVTGGMKGAARAEALERIKNGEGQVIIGTHALFQNDVDYYNLGMVITDEQHRFGVAQRSRLAHKGGTPHTLVMSATPIPRTLALVFYGDLDISTIDEMPAGRKKVKTYFYREQALPKILDFMAKEMDKGYQALLVCPFVEASEEMDEVYDTERVFRRAKKFYKGRCTVDCLNGRMDEGRKARAIADYNSGKTQLLVATSIIEVGIDVPDISVITILSADRFGLSQLHQLRGRAGRGDQQAYCFLVSDSTADKTIERMRVIVENHSGQKIAEADYRLRGPGDYFGCRQHGLPEFSALDPYTDMDLIAGTRELAAEIDASPDKAMMIYKDRIIASFNASVSDISMN